MAGGCDPFLREFEFPQVPHLVSWHSSLLEHQPDKEGLEGDINVFSLIFFKNELKGDIGASFRGGHSGGKLLRLRVRT